MHHCDPLSNGHWAINIMNKHFIHAGPAKGPEFLSVYLSMHHRKLEQNKTILSFLLADFEVVETPAR